jgi:peptidoglycan/LPS O-acetylase OafA/YrhL
LRNRIFGAIGVIWGGLILARTFFVGGPQGSGAYHQGQMAAIIFAAVLVIVGAYYLLKGNNRAKT